MNKAILIMALAVVGIFLLTSSSPKEDKITLKTALDKHLVTASFSSLGGHSGYCISMTLKNNTSQNRTVIVEPGRRLESVIEDEQDIFVVRESIVTLGPGQRIISKIFGFCCEASNHSPKKKSLFRSGKMADTNWVKLAEYINSDTFSQSMMQSAVWVMSNDHSPSSIFAGEDPKGKQLVARVCKIKNLPIPSYQVQYADGDSLSPFSNRPEKLKLKFNFTYFERNSELTVKVFNERGLVIKMINHPHLMSVGKSTTELDLTVVGWKNGTYTVQLYADNRIIDQKCFSM